MEVRDGRWGVHPTTIIIWLFIVYGFDLWEWADSTLFTISICIYSLGEIPLGVWLRVLASVG